MWNSYFNAIIHTCNQPPDEDDEIPINIWQLIGDVGCDALTYNAKTKITFNAVLFKIRNFRYWVEYGLCKEIMETVFQMQQEATVHDASDETAFFTALKYAVVRWQFLIFEKLTLQLLCE